jgi:hypothetical protein
MYDAVSNNLFIREWLNGSLFPLSLNLSIIIAVFLWDSFLEGTRQSARWWKMPGVPTACALFWIFGMESVRAGTVWLILRITNDGGVVPVWLSDVANASITIAGIILIITMLRCTFLFTPPRWGNRVWVYSIISTVTFLLLSALLSIFT